jgi:hypothetical protein
MSTLKTNMTVYINDIYLAEETITDESDGSAWNPDTAKYYVLDSSGTIVVASTTAQTTDNQIYALIDTTVTGTVGRYKIVWTAEKTVGGNTYKRSHITELQVLEISSGTSGTSGTSGSSGSGGS